MRVIECTSRKTAIAESFLPRARARARRAKKITTTTTVDFARRRRALQIYTLLSVCYLKSKRDGQKREKIKLDIVRFSRGNKRPWITSQTAILEKVCALGRIKTNGHVRAHTQTHSGRISKKVG